jgi:protein-S-isoprenylcysteine O-methyltransferase Ste14
MGRVVTLIYGAVCYALAMATILFAICFIGGFGPLSLDSGGPVSGTMVAIVIDLVLLGVFAIQHSVMARPAFKTWWAGIVPGAIERSTYVLASSLALLLLYWQWRPIGGVVWEVKQPVLAGALIAVFWLGWAVLFLSTFLINHFDLFGLAQVWNAWRGTPAKAPEFKTPLFYRFVRHPIYVGFLLAFWATPRMTQSHLLFAAASTGYIFVGMWLEERDLLVQFGDAYRRYRERVSMIVPLPPRKG